MELLNITSQKIEDEIRERGACATNTQGASMRPLLRANDAVFLTELKGDIKKYDVVLYRGTDKYILHRVIGFKGGHLVIRGDNTYRKEYVPRERVIACMVSFTRKGKRHRVDEFGYKFYSRFWNFIYPLRWLLHKFRSMIRKITKKQRCV